MFNPVMQKQKKTLVTTKDVYLITVVVQQALQSSGSGR